MNTEIRSKVVFSECRSSSWRRLCLSPRPVIGNIMSNKQSRHVVTSGSTVQRIVFGPGDFLFDTDKIVIKQFLRLCAGDARIPAIDQRHGNFCGHERAGGIGGVFGGGHRSTSYRWIRDRFQLAREPSIAPVLFLPFRARAAHAVLIGPRRVEQRLLSERPRRAATSRLRTGAGVANNTLDTYESENSLIWNLPSGYGSAIHHRIEVSSIEATLPFYGG